jgi:hypothetical protein
MDLYLDRQLNGVGPEFRWGFWHVVDAATDAVVGIVMEERERAGLTSGPARYTALVRRGANPQWRSDGYLTPMAALVALREHLAR